MQYDVAVSNRKFSLSKSKQKILVDGKEVDYEMRPIKKDTWLFYYKNKCHQISLVKTDGKVKTFAINDKVVEANISTEMDRILEQLGMDIDATPVINEIHAPMPGAILDVLVTEGQEVKTGDKLVILEAMKMENIIKSPVDGIITEVKIQKGINVEKGQPMIRF